MKTLTGTAETHVEYLPLVIKAYDERFIVTLLDHVACLDAKKSGAKKEDGEIRSVARLVLRDTALPTDRVVSGLRISERGSRPRGSGGGVSGARLTGIEYVEQADYSER